MPALHRCNNIADLRLRAKSKLPAPMFHYIDGGADDEWTMRRNTDAFDDLQLMPNYLRNIEHIDLKTNVLGTQLCRACFTMRKNMLPAKQRISTVLCTVYLHCLLRVLKI